MNIALLLIGLALAALLAWTFRRKGVSVQQRKRIEKLIEHVSKTEVSAVSVLEADTVLHQALKAAGGRGSMGDCLKQFKGRLFQEQAVWEAHKLRNRIAHEPQVSVSAKQAKQATDVLLQEARKVLTR